MQDAWRAYLELALGLTEASRRKAEQVARDLLKRTGATAGQLQSLVEELLSTSRANREELAKLVRYEVDRALGVVGLATAEEVAQLTTRIRRLERRLDELAAAASAPVTSAAAPEEPVVTGRPAARKAAAARTSAKRVPAKAVKRTAARKATEA